ncbi:MAG: VCBS repeat-containing protein, partial [Verrucomicrobiae bacterium]|nr:VCBS repeat-containing protein [Verrucomicrobiae bacterium]
MNTGIALTLSLASASALTAAEFRFSTHKIDDIQIGYGIQIADVNGDGKVDILLADKSTVQWYQAPDWQKHIIASGLTEKDNVCITARDLDGDGKCEIAVGAQWNPGNTTDPKESGAVFQLVPGKDRTAPWKPVRLHNEPTVHRMHWIKSADGRYSLVVKPLHGRGNKNGEGKGGLILEYHPANAGEEWKMETVSDFMHL